MSVQCSETYIQFCPIMSRWSGFQMISCIDSETHRMAARKPGGCPVSARVRQSAHSLCNVHVRRGLLFSKSDSDQRRDAAGLILVVLRVGRTAYSILQSAYTSFQHHPDDGNSTELICQLPYHFQQNESWQLSTDRLQT